MNRRTFLRRVSAGLVGVAVATQISPSILEAVGLREPVKRWALERLTKLYNEHYKATGKVPTTFYVGAKFYEALMFELEPIHRYTSTKFDSPRYAYFRTAKVFISHHAGAYEAGVGHTWVKTEMTPWTSHYEFSGQARRLYGLRDDGKEFGVVGTLSNVEWHNRTPGLMNAVVDNMTVSLNEFLDPFMRVEYQTLNSAA